MGFIVDILKDDGVLWRIIEVIDGSFYSNEVSVEPLLFVDVKA